MPGGAFFGGADSLALHNSGVEKYPLLGQSTLVGSQRLIALRICLLGYCKEMVCPNGERVVLFLGKFQQIWPCTCGVSLFFGFFLTPEGEASEIC